MARVANRGLDLFGASKLDQRLPPGLCRIHPCSCLFFDQQVEITLEFRVELTFELLVFERNAQHTFESRQKWHLSPSAGLEDLADSQNEAGPAQFFLAQSSAAGGCDLVEFGATVILGLPPRAFDPTLLLHAVEGREQRSRLDLKHTVCDLFYAAGDPKPMHRCEGQGLEDQHIESASEDVCLVFYHQILRCCPLLSNIYTSD